MHIPRPCENTGRRWLSPEAKPCQSLAWDFPASGTVRNSFLLWSSWRVHCLCSSIPGTHKTRMPFFLYIRTTSPTPCCPALGNFQIATLASCSSCRNCGFSVDSTFCSVFPLSQQLLRTGTESHLKRVRVPTSAPTTGKGLSTHFLSLQRKRAMVASTASLRVLANSFSCLK